MASIGGLDMSFCGIPTAFGSISMDGDEYVRCSRCSYGGCDVRVAGCGCTLHARCLQLNSGGPLTHCPQCLKPTQGLVLFPMSFREIDEARRTASAILKFPKDSRGKKRKGGAGSEPEETGGYISERRTGRWTTEEMAVCDQLMATFASGDLPVIDGTKLNEFLGNMLKSKQSRLTKKMKNAKLSSKVYKRGKGCLDPITAREYSELEEAFFQGSTDLQERAEIKFHMQKEWRELLTQVCTAIGQPLDADAWLSSVEEMDRRDSQAKDAARMAKRKLMMGVALKADTQDVERGVFIEKTDAESRVATYTDDAIEEELLNMLADEKSSAILEINGKSSLLHSAPFLTKITAYLQRHAVGFEHVDVWVPSFVGEGEPCGGPSCRLCYAGSATVEKLVDEAGNSTRDLTADEKFNLEAFGDYSTKFSFDVGCGLPGRVYEGGRPTWEQSVHNAPHVHFERCGGARQWGIKTVLGLPIASPNVGRIVVVFYSCYDRPKDADLVSRLTEELTRLMPSPKWKLVVDVGGFEDTASQATSAAATTAATMTSQYQHPSINSQPDIRDAGDFGLLQVDTDNVPVSATSTLPFTSRDPRIDEVIALLGEFMPSDPNSPSANYLSGFMSLRLLMLRHSRSHEEQELVRTVLESYSSYAGSGRERSDIAIMLARDYIFLTQQSQNAFLTIGPNFMSSVSNDASNSGLSLFGLPSTSSSLQNSPALTPIPAPGVIDSLSIVST